jgi:hypothetical protein
VMTRVRFHQDVETFGMKRPAWYMHGESPKR